MEYKVGLSGISESDFEKFIIKISDDFMVPLLPRIDVHETYTKFKNLAVSVVCLESNKIVGLAATYCNNLETRKGYTTFVGADKEYRGNHIGTNLMLLTIDEARKKGMEYIGVHTNNPIAKRMYENIGFLQVDDNSGDHSYNWYLEKELGDL